MKILFLGTGAADWPADRNMCEKEYRRNSSILIDNKILIDPGPGVLDAICEYSVDILGIKYILITHRHRDHFCHKTLEVLLQNGAQVVEFVPNEKKRIQNYSILALTGNHGVKTLHYLIYDGQNRIFYGMDGAWLMHDEVEAIKRDPVDYAVFDGTIGFVKGDYRIFAHNNLTMISEMRDTLQMYIKRFCISHMAYTLHPDHFTLSEEMQKIGIEVAYDGMYVVL